MTTVVLDAFDVRARGKGVSRALRNIITRLVATSGPLRFVVVTTSEGAALLGDVPRESIRIVPDSRGSLWEQYALPLAARRAGATLIYTQRECPPLWGPAVVAHIHEHPATRWARAQSVPVRERARRAYTRAVMTRGLQRARTIVASTAATADALVDDMGIARGRVVVARLGVDQTFFDGRPQAGAPYIFHLGSSDARDNTVLVARAYAVLASRGFAPRLVIAGDLGALGPAVRAAIKDGDVELAGRVSDDDLVSLYAGATVTVQPSSDEGFGLQPLEAMAAGSALVAFDTPAVREVAGDACRLVGALDPQVLADAIGSLLEDRPERDRLAAAGRARAAEFTWDATVEQIYEILTAIVSP